MISLLGRFLSSSQPSSPEAAVKFSSGLSSSVTAAASPSPRRRRSGPAPLARPITTGITVTQGVSASFPAGAVDEASPTAPLIRGH